MNINKKNLKLIKPLSGFLVTILTVYLWSCTPASSPTIDRAPVVAPTLSALSLSYYGKDLALEPTFAAETTAYTSDHIEYGSGTANDAYTVTPAVDPAVTATATTSFEDDTSANTRTVTITVTDGADVNNDATYTVTITLDVTTRLTKDALQLLATSPTVTIDNAPLVPAAVFVEDATDPNTNTHTYADTGDAFSVDTPIALAVTTGELGTRATISPASGSDSVLGMANTAITETLTVTLTESAAEGYTVPADANSLRQIVYSVNIARTMPGLDFPALSALSVSYYGKVLVDDGTSGFAFDPATEAYRVSHIEYGSGTSYDAYTVTFTVDSAVAATAATSFKDDTSANTRTVKITVTETLDPSVTRPALTADYDVIIDLDVTTRLTKDALQLLATSSVVTIDNAPLDPAAVFVEDATDSNTNTHTYADTGNAFSVDTTIALAVTTGELGTPPRATISPESGSDSVLGMANTAITETLTVTLTESAAEGYTVPADANSLRQIVYSVNITRKIPGLTDLTVSYYGKALTSPTLVAGETDYTVADAHVDYGLAMDSAGNDAYIATTTVDPAIAATVSGVATKDTPADLSADPPVPATRTLTITVTETLDPSVTRPALTADYDVTFPLVERSIATIDASLAKSVSYINSAGSSRLPEVFFTAAEMTPTTTRYTYTLDVEEGYRGLSFGVNDISATDGPPVTITTPTITAPAGASMVTYPLVFGTDYTFTVTVTEDFSEYSLLPTTVAGSPIILTYELTYMVDYNAPVAGFSSLTVTPVAFVTYAPGTFHVNISPDNAAVEYTLVLTLDARYEFVTSSTDPTPITDGATKTYTYDNNARTLSYYYKLKMGETGDATTQSTDVEFNLNVPPRASFTIASLTVTPPDGTTVAYEYVEVTNSMNPSESVFYDEFTISGATRGTEYTLVLPLPAGYEFCLNDMGTCPSTATDASTITHTFPATGTGPSTATYYYKPSRDSYAFINNVLVVFSE